MRLNEYGFQSCAGDENWLGDDLSQAGRDEVTRSQDTIGKAGRKQNNVESCQQLWQGENHVHEAKRIDVAANAATDYIHRRVEGLLAAR